MLVISKKKVPEPGLKCCSFLYSSANSHSLWLWYCSCGPQFADKSKQLPLLNCNSVCSVLFTTCNNKLLCNCIFAWSCDVLRYCCMSIPLYACKTTVEPLLATTPDERPPCLWRALTLVPTALPFRIVLKKPLFCSHLSTPYRGVWLQG